MSILFEASILPGFVRVEHTPRFIRAFDTIYKLQTEILYNHHPAFPFSYLNRGRLELYINDNFEYESSYIPVVKKFGETPSFFLHAPAAEVKDILHVVDLLTPKSVHPVKICDVTEGYANWFLEQTEGWEALETSRDIIQDAAVLASLKGRGYSSLRNTLKHARNDLKPRTEVLSPSNYKDALKVFEDWKNSAHAKKLFRITIGRDYHLIEEYYDKIDLDNFFAFVHYVDDYPCACAFGTRSAKDREWGQDVTCKSDVTKKGLADFAFIHLCTEMNKAGIKFVNDSGYYSPSIKLNKLKMAPVRIVKMFDLVRVESKECPDLGVV